MVDILKITSTISPKQVESVPKRKTTDAIFDLEKPIVVGPKEQLPEQKDTRTLILDILNKEIFKPLLKDTNSLAMSMRKLVLLTMLFGDSSTISEDFLFKMFTYPGELLDELVERDQAATIFKGEFFDSLRKLSKIEGQPQIKEAIISILKHFDCHVNLGNSQKAVIIQSNLLLEMISEEDKQILNQHIANLEKLSDFKDVNSYLKNDLIPFLSELAKKYQANKRVVNTIMAIVHHAVRYDKGDPERLEQAIIQLGNELKQITSLKDEDIAEMKKMVFDHAKEVKEIILKDEIEIKELAKLGLKFEKADMPTLIRKALDREGPYKITNTAQNLLTQMLQSESPIMSLIHYMIPLRYLDENTYGEFFIDKNKKDEKNQDKKYNNIYFTIQSDKYGDFEVDLIEKDKRIDLSINCPEALLSSIRAIKSNLRTMIEEQGYTLSNYEVGVYTGNQKIVKRFPKLAQRKVGFDVKI
ncbi:MAG: hypothetical protein GX076_07660 [Clostridiales bacterium]|nr:hypothetical protein [Clostridiales bacterium]